MLDVWFSLAQNHSVLYPSLEPKVTSQHSALSLLPTKVTSAQQQYLETYHKRRYHTRIAEVLS